MMRIQLAVRSCPGSVSHSLFKMMCHVARSLVVYLVLSQQCLPAMGRVVFTNPTLASNLKEVIAARFDSMPQMHNQQFVKVFVLNKKELGAQTRQQVNATGLNHLMSLSSGQLMPMLKLILSSVIGLVTWILLRRVCLVSLFQLNRALAHGVRLVMGVCFTLVFGATGALHRALFLSLVRFIPARLTWALGYRLQVMSLQPTMNRAVLLLVLGFFLPEAFSNLSFILSALGAAVASACHIMIRNFYDELPTLCQVMLIQFLCCFVLSLLLSDSENLGRSILANLIAIPYTTWVITPLSLLVFCLPTQNFILVIFDHALSIFATGIRFMSQNANFAESGKMNVPFLTLVLLLLWSVDDFMQAYPKWRTFQRR